MVGTDHQSVTIDVTTGSTYTLLTTNQPSDAGTLEREDRAAAEMYFPFITKSCVTLAVPEGHVTFLTFLYIFIFIESCDVEHLSDESEHLTLSSGPCACDVGSRHLWTKCGVVRPPPAFYPHPYLSFYLATGHGPELASVVLRFSFHR